MTKKKLGKIDASTAPSVLLKKPKPKKKTAEKKEAPRLTAARLRELAAKHKPPQSWFEEDLDGI